MNLADYGAKLDGNTDEGPLLNQAIIDASQPTGFGTSGDTINIGRGTLLTSVPVVQRNKVRIVCQGPDATVIKAATNFPKGVPVLQQGVGGANPGGYVFGTRLLYGTIDCADVADIGVYSVNAQEHSGLTEVTVKNARQVAVHYGPGSQNLKLDDLFIVASKYRTPTGILWEAYSDNSIDKVTLDTPPGGGFDTGILVQNAFCRLGGIHAENCIEGIRFGQNGQGAILGASGNASTGTLVHLLVTAAGVTVIALYKNGSPNVLVDDKALKTFTSNVRYYAS